MSKVIVVGQVARDLVLRIDRLPDEGGSAPIQERQELLGGKGANQAVACRQLGADVALIGVVGDDQAGQDVLDQAAADGIGVHGVIRRAGASTALLVDITGPAGVRRLLEDVDAAVLLERQDVDRSEAQLRLADAVLVQLQQPAAAVTLALETAASAGALVVTDGAPADEETRRHVLSHSAVVRADAEETEVLVGWKPDDLAQTIEAAQALVKEGPRIVALAAPTEGNVVAWAEGYVVLPFLEKAPVDPTGAGDAFVAALTIGLLRGESAQSASWWAAAAAAQVVTKPGGRPDLNLDSLRAAAQRAQAVHANP